MTALKALLKMNLKRRMTDGFALGYNIIFPLLMTWLLGLLCRKIPFGTINGYQYYSIVMIPFSIVMAIVTAAYAGKDDAYAKTAERVLMTPVSYAAIVAAKVIAEVIVFCGCACIVMTICEFLWKGSIFDCGLSIFFLYLSLSLFTAGIGTWIGLGMKNFLIVKNFITVPVCVCAILGGCFFRIGTMKEGLQILLEVSPFTWINRSIFLEIYDKSGQPMRIVSLILALFGILFTILAIVSFKKEEYGNGEIPGYEK